ncbi:MAG: hypothetical protein ACE5NC_05370 [Anaerolineae bacterium]
MSPNEMATLVLIDRLGHASKWAISRKLAVSTDYAAHLCQSLMRRGYLAVEGGGSGKSKPKSARYRLGDRGVVAVLAELMRVRGTMAGRAEHYRRYEERIDDRIAKLAGRESRGE